MLRLLIIAVLLLSNTVGWGAIIKLKKDKGPDIDLVSWVTQKGDSLPQEISGVKIFRPNENDSEGNPVVRGSIFIPDVSIDNAFTNAIFLAATSMNRELETICELDYANKSFAIERQLITGDGSSQSIYRYVTEYSFREGAMDFISRDISIEYKDRGIILRRLPLGKLKPAVNERHFQLLEDFSEANSQLAHELVNNASRKSGVIITHWPEIKRGQVVKGMNYYEVRIIGGEPRNISGSHDREQWIFNNDFVVIFSNGIVSNVIQ